MSVLSVPSPVLAKRHFDEGEAGEGCDRQLGGKRSRQHYSPAAARCVQFAAGGLHAVAPTTLSALLALFPGMDERTVSNVLSECGNNIDAAIRRLGELRLSAAGEAASTQPAPTGAAPTHHTADAGAPGTPQAATGIPTPAALDPESNAAGSSGGPATAEQWVEVLVAEMSAASDMTDARNRAAGFLRQFEAFVARFVRQQQQQQAASSAADPSAASASDASLAARAAKLAEENAVLKKAVQIQHRQLQERAGQDGEVAQLKALLAQYQEQVRTLQVNNYSLTLHLQKATNSGFVNSPRNPDVF
ncbi:hypothetical protein Agub_g7157 [Astrephomene gubernaculifera]|uniref:CUE domain-containing protein n=1 Tax=Astrephomene gubernaculifera TaxID=47775 RepID=A0AAD3HM81_9CHLO|nr:hypothetical protein Agub_g7157 [Astrephomene gubernaculifera]